MKKGVRYLPIPRIKSKSHSTSNHSQDLRRLTGRKDPTIRPSTSKSNQNNTEVDALELRQSGGKTYESFE